MPPAFALTRRPTPGVDPYDRDAVCTWLLDTVRDEVRRRGQPSPRIALVGDGYCESLDLDAVARQDPTASIAATLGRLAERPGIEHRFLVLVMIATDRAGAEHRAAVVVEERVPDDEPDDGRPEDPGAVRADGARAWWCATLPYSLDPTTGLGVPEPSWGVVDHAGIDALPAALRGLLLVPPDARAARVVPPRPPAPDIKVAFGALPPGIDLPADALGLAEVVHAMTVGEICRDGLGGMIVLRFSGNTWEWWVLGEDQPASIDDMVRYICQRPPAADAVALVLLALFGADAAARPGIQIVAERAGTRAERWVLLDFPEGPKGPRRAGRTLWRGLLAPAEGDGWLGVDPMVAFEIGPIGGIDE